MGSLVYIVIALLVMLTSIGLLTQIKENTEDSMEGTLCRASLKVQDKSDDIALIPHGENVCETMLKHISVKKKTKGEVMHEIAELMKNSWWITHKGTIKGMWSAGDVNWLSKGDYSCFGLYHIVFDDVGKQKFEGNTITQEELLQYLKNYKANNDYTYHAYIQQAGGNGMYRVTDVHLEKEYAISMASPSFSIWFDEDESSEIYTGLYVESVEKSVSNGCVVI